MIRLLGVLFLLLLMTGAFGWYLGWFSLSTTTDGQNRRISVVLDGEKMRADGDAAKAKLGGNAK